MKDFTEIAVIMDKSGSMKSVEEDAIGGFNSFVKEQIETPGDANLTLVMFDTEICQGPAVPIKDVKPLCSASYVPGGFTALLDAVGETIRTVGKRLDDLQESERPDKVIFVIITDGHENKSQEYTREQIKEMVTHQQEKYNWQFIFLGANIDAFAEAATLGIQSANVANYGHDPIGTRSAYAGASRAVKQYRSAGTIDNSWNKNIKN